MTDALYYGGACSCGQGELAVWEDPQRGCLFLECNECSSAWPSPEAFEAQGPGSLNTDPQPHVRLADAAAIERHGWARYWIYRRMGDVVFPGISGTALREQEHER